MIFRADREAEIRGALKFADEMKLKPIILGGNDAWKVASLLKEKNVPVILTGLFSLPSREDDAYDALYENPASCSRRAFVSPFDRRCGRGSSQSRAICGNGGRLRLSKADAVKAVTLYPAQIMNVSDRLGRSSRKRWRIRRDGRRSPRNSYAHTIFVHRWASGGVKQ